MELSKELRELIKSEAASMHPDSQYEQGQAVLLMKLGAVLALESTGWISVEERPKEDGPYLTCFAGTSEVRWWNGEDSRWERFNDTTGQWNQVYIGFWMPLPEPPKP